MTDWAAMVENRDRAIEELTPLANAYKELAQAIRATMEDPDAWDGDGDEASILLRYVSQWRSVHPADRPDCPHSRHGGQHCLHFQEGDGSCCDCGRPNWQSEFGEGDE